MNPSVHVISHTHWDREWYMPYEKHHVRLIELMDRLLDVLERNPGFRSFHLDGQTIVLDDYLEVRPERRDQVMRYVAEGRLSTGPWYILQDEFLTSGEANLRNLLIGHRDAARYGAVTKIGYFPDSFGNIGQAPQILKQAGMATAVFGRGVKPTGFNNAVAESAHYESPYSEMVWRSPDGSEVLGILFANWYHNGMEIPTDPEQAAAYWRTKLADVERYASTRHLLFMNGCDHQPVQLDVPLALETAAKLYPELTFIHSNFADYAEAVASSVPEDLTVVQGELRSQRTDGWGTLVNTASARVYIKQENDRIQTLLENVAEPLATFAAMAGTSYPHHLFVHAWKILMQNHPHDSICGCSVDEVHREMMTRFAKSRHLAEALATQSAEAIAARADTSAFSDYAGARPFVAFNTSGWMRNGTIEIELEIARAPLGEDFAAVRAGLAAISAVGRVIDPSGNPVVSRTEDLGVRFGYELPDDRFRQPYWARVIRIVMQADHVPALGYGAYAWIPTDEAEAEPQGSLFIDGRTMENDRLRVTVADDGTLTLTDKENGRTYGGLCEYENVGDIGNEYMFKQPEGEVPLTTKGLPAQIRAAEDLPFRATLEFRHEWEIPGSADALLEEEREAMVPFPVRKAQRSAERVPFVVTTRVTLEKGSETVQVSVSFDNTARDHRLRVLVPTGIETDRHYADSIFEIPERPNVPAPEWTNPSYCHHQQSFAGVDNEEEGFLVANRGLNEYEVLRDGRNTIAVTLLRAVGELGDWGVFPTPEAQCPGRHTAEFALIPYRGAKARSGAAARASQYKVPWTVRQTDVHEGKLPSRHAFLAWEGDSLALTAVKVNENTGDLMFRWYNMSRSESRLTAVLQAVTGEGEWYESNVLEEVLSERQPGAAGIGRIEREVRPSEIVTLGFRTK
ncbi:alpha-mannosidase [Cohnella candidum]|nr:alpha-mannosidase [Cohnella candidum]